MSYTVLARRYRSGTFDEVIGQDHVAQTLKKAIASGRIAHAYLFCGTRGVGKTSMARILAKALNCRAFDEPTTEPCGKCDSCVAISRGDDIDVLEIDAASNTGVDNVREVIENSQYRPARSRFKIYIIDEAHMLSKAAFNALLKTLEEPPSHVKFILATTEAEKLLPTILSRCQRYDFRNIPTREIAEHLADLCKREKVKADEDALLLVAKAGAGSMRDSLSLLDRLLSIGEKHLTADMIEQMLGLPKSQLLFDLAGAIAGGDVKSVLGQANAIVQAGLSADSLIVALVDHLRNLLILRSCGPDSTLVEVPGLAMKDLVAQAERFDAGVLAQDIAVLEELRRTLRQSQAGRALLDATLVRLTLADQFASIGDLLSQISGGGSARPATSPRPGAGRAPTAPAAPPAQKKNLEPELSHADQAMSHKRGASFVQSQSVPVASGPLMQQADVAAPAVQDATAAIADSGDDQDGDALPAVGKVWATPTESLATLMARHRAGAAAASPASPATVQRIAVPATAAYVTASAAAPVPVSIASQDANVEPVDRDNLPVVWEKILGLLSSQGPMVHSLISQGQLVGIDEGRVVLRFAAQQETFVRKWEKNGKREAICEAASQVLNQPMGVKFEIAGGEAPASAPVPQGVVAPVSPRVAVPRPGSQPAADATPPPTPEAPTVKVTNELVDALVRDNPLIKTIMQRLGGQVVKVE
jgi:DNA polymerase-3 subunit gamma/tau